MIVLGFGKHQGAPVHELAAGPDRSFLQWVIGKDFPPHVGEICRAALEHPGEAFITWARQRFGQAAPTEKPPFAAQVPASLSLPAAQPESLATPGPVIDQLKSRRDRARKTTGR